jgi:hypothetical protein
LEARREGHLSAREWAAQETANRKAKANPQSSKELDPMMYGLF